MIPHRGDSHSADWTLSLEWSEGIPADRFVSARLVEPSRVEPLWTTTIRFVIKVGSTVDDHFKWRVPECDR